MGSLIIKFCWPRYGAERSGEHVSLGLVKKESLDRIENLSIFSTQGKKEKKKVMYSSINRYDQATSIDQMDNVDIIS